MGLAQNVTEAVKEEIDEDFMDFIMGPEDDSEAIAEEERLAAELAAKELAEAEAKAAEEKAAAEAALLKA